VHIALLFNSIMYFLEIIYFLKSCKKKVSTPSLVGTAVSIHCNYKHRFWCESGPGLEFFWGVCFFFRKLFFVNLSFCTPLFMIIAALAVVSNVVSLSVVICSNYNYTKNRWKRNKMKIDAKVLWNFKLRLCYCSITLISKTIRLISKFYEA
jgi:hypothetical protein